LFSNLDGVVEVIVGYSGGHTLNPTYKSINDHCECIRVYYHPQIITYEELLDVYFQEITNSGSIFRPARSSQYRNVILPHTTFQFAIAKRKLDEFIKIKAESVVSKVAIQTGPSAPRTVGQKAPHCDHRKQVYIDVEMSKYFYRAEDYHQKYFQKRNREL
jgi:peptide methionine sulfoxide reductase MsrA